jgi:anion-transporting  ArsA/GET3 family ATPase
VLNAGFSVMTGALTKLLGGQVLRDAQTFIAAFDTMFGGFRERAEATYRLLQAPGTSFLVIATPEPDALREASYFVERLAEERMPLAGLILNRVHAAGVSQLSAARSVAAAETLETMIPNGSVAGASSAGDTVTAAGLTAAALRLHAERMNLGLRERRVAGSFMSAHPAVPVIEIPALPEDVHDLAGLRRIGGCFGHTG